MQALGLMLMAAAAISGCSSQSEVAETPIIREPDPVVVEEPEPMSLAFASVSNARAMTRLTDDIVQLNGAENYRPISNRDIHFIALKKNESKVITDVSNVELTHTESLSKRDGEDKEFSRYYHSRCEMPLGTNGSLVYAKAEDKAVDMDEDGVKTDLEKKIYNGCLTESSYLSDYVKSTDQITFEPVSIYNDATVGEDGIHADAWALADAMSQIVNNVPQWTASANLVLQNLLGNFTNHGFDLPGSAASVKTWIDALDDAAEKSKVLVDGPVRDILNSIRTEIVTAKSNIASLNYPQNIHLPDGAAVVRWTEVEEGGVKTNKFVPQLQTTTLDDINTITRFVYPPALYYFIESDIWTANNTKVSFEDYNGKSKWKGKGDDDDSVEKLFTGDGVVRENTKTVAVADPLQYAVAQLQMNLTASATSLPYDNSGDNDRKIDISKLSLKGIIIGGQRKVKYDFTPISDSDMDVKFVYDTQVNSAFTTAGTTSNMLVLQSWGDEDVVGEDVNVILEFEYSGDSEEDKEFKCLNGWVYPGTRFYLVGELKLKDATPSEGMSDADKNRVFTKDRITAVTMTVNSLEKAYNVLPSILSKNLEIGVQTTPKWVGTTTAPVILD